MTPMTRLRINALSRPCLSDHPLSASLSETDERQPPWRHGWSDTVNDRRRADDNERQAEVDLIARIRDGDRSAFETMYREYWPALVVFAQRYGALSRPEAEASVQSMFFDLWGKRADWRAPNGLKTYLFTAAVDRIGPAGRWRPDAGVDELTTTIAAILAAMPASCRAVYHLRHTAGLDANAVAGILDLSIVTVKRRHARALHLLAHRMAATKWGEIMRHSLESGSPPLPP
jgi:DNA-directed RNA polymerase specialized sigma24 family protein